MQNQSLSTENTDEDKTHVDGPASSAMLDRVNSRRSISSALSNEDLNQYLYAANIDWRRRFSIRLLNGQLVNLSCDRHERTRSDDFSHYVDISRTDALHPARHRTSYWLRYRTAPPSSSFDEHNCFDISERLSSSASTPTYARLRAFTRHLLTLERQARRASFDRQWNIRKSLKTANSTEKPDRSLKKNDDQHVSAVHQRRVGKRSFHLPTQSPLVLNANAKISRAQSWPQIKKSALSHVGPIRRVKTVSLLNLAGPDRETTHPTAALTCPIAVKHAVREKNVSVPKERQISYEVKTNCYQRKVEVKTKQEETICTTRSVRSPLSPSIVTRVIKAEVPLSPHRVHINQQPGPSNPSSSVRSVRVSVSTSPHGNESEKTATTEFPFPTLPKASPNREQPSRADSYSSVISSFIAENLDESSRLSEEETFDRRPLLDLISEINRRHTLNQPSASYAVPSDHRSRSRTYSPSASTIRPPKPLSPFRPIIVHRKYQEPIGRFGLVDAGPASAEASAPPQSRRHHRVPVVRSRTFNNRNNLNANATKAHPVETPPNENVTCQSTPELSYSNGRERARNQPPVNMEETCGLSTNNAVLAGTSLTGLTPTPGGTIDDKNETKRKAIAMQMFDTEKSYVEALKDLVTKYYLPMKDKAVISNDLVNDIFYKIPEIHIHHTAFLISLSQKLSEWDNKQTVGDLLLQMFTRTSVIETYTSFVNNYKTAQIAIRLCRDSSSFNKFLEHQARDHRGKLTLRDLIIQPVQRIPRYELYIKDFLKCTNLNHPDYQLLLKAQSEIHSLAEQIDQVQKDVGSTELTITNNSLEAVQEMIENLTDLVTADRYYIRHDVVTLQSPSGLKKDRYIFLFNDLLIITSCKRRSGTLTKKSSSSVIVNSPSGKQYIDNFKHKLIMRLPLESVDLAADHLKKRRTPPTMTKFQSMSNSSGDKCRHLEDDAATLGHMTDLARTITVPHQQLDESIKEVLHTVNRHLTDETTSVTSVRAASPELVSVDHVQSKSSNIQLTIRTTERTETIDVLFMSSELKATWKKSFLEAKKVLFEVAAGRRNISFQNVLTLPHGRPGSQFSCGTARLSLGDICICNSEGQVCLVNLQSDVTLKACNTVISSRISCAAYVPSHKGRRAGSSIKNHHQHQGKQKSENEGERLRAHESEVKQEPTATPSNSDVPLTGDSLLDIDSSDDEDASTAIHHEDTCPVNSSDQTGPFAPSSSLESDGNAGQRDTREATMWLGTDDGAILIFQCTETVKTVARKTRIVKQLGSAIHSILYTDNKVFVALNHGELAVFRRDMSGCWDLDGPAIRSIEDGSARREGGLAEPEDSDNVDPISVMALAAGKLWCAVRDRIYVVCPNSLNVEHSFLVDDCHRHVCSIATGGSSVHHVWIASQGSQEIRLYHATHFVCLLEVNIRTVVTQKLQVCDDIIRAHKLGCLRVSALHVCKETLWVGTSAGLLINVSMPQLVDSASSKLTVSSLQLKSLSFGHAGPVRFIISTDIAIASAPEEVASVKTLVLSIGDGFEDYTNNDEALGKDDALSHVIVWQL